MAISSHGFLAAALQEKGECAHSTHEKAEHQGHRETSLGDRSGYTPGESFQGSILGKVQMASRTRTESSPPLGGRVHSAAFHAPRRS